MPPVDLRLETPMFPCSGYTMTVHLQVPHPGRDECEGGGSLVSGLWEFHGIDKQGEAYGRLKIRMGLVWESSCLWGGGAVKGIAPNQAASKVSTHGAHDLRTSCSRVALLSHSFAQKADIPHGPKLAHPLHGAGGGGGNCAPDHRNLKRACPNGFAKNQNSARAEI